jgi:hypothetical protein
MFLKRRYDISVRCYTETTNQEWSLGEHIFDRDLSDRDVCWFAIPLAPEHLCYDEEIKSVSFSSVLLFLGLRIPFFDRKRKTIPLNCYGGGVYELKSDAIRRIDHDY